MPPPGAGLTTVKVEVPATAMSAAAMVAVNCIELIRLVVRGLAFQFTTLPVTKFVPYTDSVKPAEPAVTDAGEIPVREGGGLLMVNVALPDVPPPGAGFTTATLSVPAAATSAAAITAVNWLELTTVVVRLLPFHNTVLPGTKFVPVTASVKVVEPAVAEVGEVTVSEGTGLLMVNVALPDVPPPGVGFITVTVRVPAAATSAAVITAVSCVELTKVVVRLLPFHNTVLPDTKFVPVTVSVKVVEPAVADVGEIPVSEGTG